MKNASEWTAQELLDYGYAMAYKRRFNADSVDDAAQEFAVGAWLAQRQLDATQDGLGRGYVTQGGLNGLKAYVRHSVKGKRIARKPVEDIDGETYEVEEMKILAGDYNSEDGEGALSVWDTIADPKAVNPLDATVGADALQNARDALQSLTALQRDVILARADGETLQSIGDRLGVTRERVRQIEDGARKIALLVLS